MTFPVPRPESGLGRWVKEPFCGLSHGVGALLSIAGLVLLIVWSRPEPALVAAVCIYGASMILLFTASCLVHSVHCSERIENRLERLDYAAIFFLIAGTYTPVCLSVLWGPWGWTILAIEWSLAIFGATMVLTRGVGRFWVLLYVPMGWLVLVAMVPLINRMPLALTGWLLAGGAIYSIGAVVFVTNRPRLWPGRFGSHDLWHLLVLSAAACHFIVVTRLTSA